MSTPIGSAPASFYMTPRLIVADTPAIPASGVSEAVAIPPEVLAHAVRTAKTSFEGAPPTVKLSNGDLYTGSMKGGRPHGGGVLISDATSHYQRYAGEFFEGVRQGKGTQTYKNGSVYEGDWVKGRWEGKGTWSWVGDLYDTQIKRPQRIIYEGSFVHGDREGKGTEIAFYPVSNRSSWKKGTWKKGEFYVGYYLDPNDWKEKKLVPFNSSVTYSNHNPMLDMIHQ
jgi:hypothetical protein